MSSHRRGGTTAPAPDDLRARSLPPVVERLVEDYRSAFACRDRYMWGWLDAVLPEFRLDSVPGRYEDVADEGRLLVSVYVTALNDLSDRRSDYTAFEAAARVPREGPPEPGSPADEPAVRVAADAWAALVDRLADAPNFEYYRATLHEALAGSAEAQRHSVAVADDPESADYDECLRAQSSTMCMDALATVDLICSPGVDPNDEPELREAIELVEPLGRIGNWLTTWERELSEGDLANGVVVRAVDDGVVSSSDVFRARDDPSYRPLFAERIREASVERTIGRERARRLERACEREWETTSIDLDGFVRAMETVWSYHEASAGHK
ncbi:hypothetical protein [Candidatus Halobonum tyrrellensis]|uniref:Uncharacterized protein n=1 Tax=Candidatus Halobonum tyrrellensis G22 TaxID=1324957 RepID=V4HJX5_9EURY|nr:hypothetical protein [Candidatus Halobonum tyrrellensis]ESP90073.1 hypothetical protein K933_00882 [Candidatus Halobonum tyrrellensis G22]